MLDQKKYAEAIARAAQISFLKAYERLERIKKDPDLVSAFENARFDLGEDTLVTDVKKTDKGVIEIQVMPAPAANRAKTMGAMMQIEHARRRMHLAASRFELRQTFGRAALTILGEGYDTGRFVAARVEAA